MLEQISEEGEEGRISVVTDMLPSVRRPVGMYSMLACMFPLQQTDRSAYTHAAANHYRSGGHMR